MRLESGSSPRPPVDVGLPDVDAHHLPRPRLDRRLSGVGGTPITLVCAPSGFGKTSLVGSWARHTEFPVAWLSLDPADGEVATFARRVLGAIQTIAPEAGPRTRALLRKRSPVEPRAFAAALRADLEALPGELVLVLDDYSSLPSTPVHELVDELLSVLPAPKRVVLIARYDPPLAIQELLVAGRASELRQRELAFTPEESAAALQLQLGWTPDDGQLERLAEHLDGWPTGVRLLAQGLDDPATRDRVLERLPEGVLRARRFLSAELFDRLPPRRQDDLLRCSLLESFSAPLCAVLASAAGEEPIDPGFPADESTFVEAVEGRPGWYRIRPLFRAFLEERCPLRLDADAIRGLHDAVARWLSDHGHLTEALDHALKGHRPASAAALLADHRVRLLNEGRMGEVYQALQRLPEEVIESHLDTQLLRVWGTPSEVFREAVARIETALAREDVSAERADAVRGELQLMRAGNFMSLSMEDPSGLPRLVACAEDALRLLPARFLAARAMAYHLLAQALQFQGEIQSADAVLDRGLAEFAGGGGHPLCIVHLTRAIVHLLEADLVPCRDAAAAAVALELAVPPETDPSRLQARRLLGTVHYEWNELDEAERVLDHEEGRHNLECLEQLVHVRQAQGREADASALMADLVEGPTLADTPTGALHAHANAALLALRQGDTESALRWAEGARTRRVRPFHSALSATLIRAAILAAAGEARHRELAADLLATAEQAAEQSHLRGKLLQILSIRAVLLAADGDEEGALRVLDASVQRSARSRYVRLYLDLGAPMRTLFARLTPPEGYERYVATLREAFAGERERVVGQRKQDLPDPLTDRELEVLGLIAERLSNKEVARRLHVSLPTVKSHALRIYQKLHVRGRREAVEKAIGLGILRGS